MNRPPIALLVLVLAGAAVAQERPASGDPDRRTPVVRAVEKTSPAVVNISTTRLVAQRDPWFGHYVGSRPAESMGSGSIIHPDGFVVTNSHVVRMAVDEILVSLEADGEEKQYRAALVADDPRNDLALLKILDPGQFPTLSLGRSDDLLIGEPVIAVGNPFGVGKTVTTGVVSAVNKTVMIEEGTAFRDFIQTDAAINPGNSGGPLLNIHGEMIGVNTAIRIGAEGLGFAIPVDRVKNIVVHLIESAVQRANLGFSPVAENGRLVVRSVDADGASARLRPGDVLVSVDGRPVHSVYDFATPLLAKEPGQSLRFTVLRRGEREDVEVTLPLAAEVQYLALRLGIIGEDLPAHAQARGFTGVVVKEVVPEGPAARVEIRPGDVIYQLNRWSPVGVRQLAALLARYPGDQVVDLVVIREGRRMTGSITLR